MFGAIRLYVMAAAVAGAIAAGWVGRGYVEDSRRLAEQRQQQRETFRQQERVGSAAADHEGVRAALAGEARTISREVERVVQKTVYRDVCLDDDGLQQLRAAVEGGGGGKPQPTLQAASDAGQR